MIPCAKGAILNNKELSVIESALGEAIEAMYSLVETEFRPNRLTHAYRQEMKHRLALIRSWQTSIGAIKRVRKAKRRA